MKPRQTESQQLTSQGKILFEQSARCTFVGSNENKCFMLYKLLRLYVCSVKLQSSWCMTLSSSGISFPRVGQRRKRSSTCFLRPFSVLAYSRSLRRRPVPLGLQMNISRVSKDSEAPPGSLQSTAAAAAWPAGPATCRSLKLCAQRRGRKKRCYVMVGAKTKERLSTS